jgi:hypothetical protein
MQTTRQFIINGEERTIIQKFALDGSQCMNLASNGRGDLVSRTSWIKDKLINSGRQILEIRGEKTEVSVQEEHSISKNGKRLTIKTRSVTPRGVTTLKQVYKRQRKPTP